MGSCSGPLTVGPTKFLVNDKKMGLSLCMSSFDLSAAFDVVNIKLLLYFDFRVPSVNKTYSQALTSV